MDQPQCAKTRRAFRWPKEAREFVRAYLANSTGAKQGSQSDPPALKPLIARLVQVSGNPRDACWRFARHAGIAAKQEYRPWTRKEQQKLLDMIAIQPVHEITLVLRRSP